MSTAILRSLPTLFGDIDDTFNNIFANAFTLANFNRENTLSSLSSRGLKNLISRPHNLITVKDTDGNVTGWRLETVYTPFAKKDVKVEILKNVLTVTCGNENKKIENTDEYNYRGISYQSYSFSLPIDENVDTEAIIAKADDGILKIELPLKVQKEEIVEKPIAIEVM